ncbi:MAG: response regulator [Chloroflexi bacterium]|nr:response regulator [Chloroflexota bacterium]
MTKIIVVDDDPTNVGLIKMLLELDGFEVASCSNRAETVAAAEIKTAAFVIDCNLARGASGIDILREVRNNETNAPANTLVIMTSGDYRLEDETMAAGANQFLLKPYSPTILSDAINQFLSKGGTRE